MARISKNPSKDIVKRLAMLKKLYLMVSGDGVTHNDSLRFKINEKFLCHSVIDLRESLELHKQLKVELATFEDLCKVDYLAFWKLYETDFPELSASDIVGLEDDYQINLL
jgi:hypothetical protein